MSISETGYSSYSSLVQTSPWYGVDEVMSSAKDNVTLALSGSSNVTLTLSSSASLILDVNAMLWRVVSPLLLLLGTAGNMMTVVVMRGMCRSPSMACLALYFTALALSDQSQLLTALLFFWVDKGFSWPPAFFRFNLLCSLPTFVYHVGGITSAWFLVAMTFQRVTSVVAPHRVGVLCTVRRGKMIVAVIVLIAVAMNSHILFTLVYRREYRRCQFHEQNVYLSDFLAWQFTLWYSMIPFLFLVVGNSVLIQQVIQSRRLSQQMRGSAGQQKTSGSDRIHSMSVTLIVTSVAYLAFTLPPCVFAVYVKMDDVDVTEDRSGAMTELTKSLMNVCWISATATNFYFYLLSGKKFRQETARYLRCRHTDPVERTQTWHSGKA